MIKNMNIHKNGFSFFLLMNNLRFWKKVGVATPSPALLTFLWMNCAKFNFETCVWFPAGCGAVYSWFSGKFEKVFFVCLPPSPKTWLRFEAGLNLKLGLGRISGSAGLSGQISDYSERKSRISRNIRQGRPDNSAGYPASGKKQIRPNSIWNVTLFIQVV